MTLDVERRLTSGNDGDAISRPDTPAPLQVGDLLIYRSFKVTVIHVADKVYLVREQGSGAEYTLDKEDYHTSWRKFDPFAGLKIDDPVWVRDHDDHEWRPRHYAGSNRVYFDGCTSHSVDKSDDSSCTNTWRYWKHDTLGEWESY